MSAPRPQPGSLEELLACDAFVRRCARALVRDEERAEELAQEALLSGLRSGPREPERLRGWLAGTLRRMAARERRGEARRRERERAAARPEATPSVAELAAREEARRRVVDALLELEEPYRATLVLRFYEGLPPRRVAARMGVPVETVRTRVKRGLARLRARLDEDVEGGRAVWCALLAPFAAPGVGAPLVEAARELSLEGIAMSTQGKLVAGAAALVALALVAARLDLFGAAAPALEPRGAVALERGAPEAAAPVEEERALSKSAENGRRAVAGDGAPEEEAAPPAAPAPFGSVLARVTWHDGAPAEGVWVRALPWGAAHPELGAQLAPTDARGEVRFEELAAGRVGLYSLHGGSARVELAPGEEAEARLVLPRGYDLAGSVVDLEGRPVASADIWLSVLGNLDEGAVVARSGADGGFRLRSISEAGFLGARSERHAPSLLKILVDHAEGTEVPLRLVLRGECGAVEGRVLDAGGEPVEGALVRVGAEGYRWVNEDPDTGVMAPPFEARTDEEGRFALAGLGVGPAPVAVRAVGHAPWRGEVAVLAGLTARVDAVLGPGVLVAGSVREATGAPVAGARVSSGHWGRMGFQARTDADGAFALADLPPGELELRAEADGRGKARAELFGLAGEALRWDALLSTGGEVRGRVLDERGAPLAGWSVSIESVHAGAAAGALVDHHFDMVETDASGAFALRNLGDRDHQLEVRARDGGFFPSLVKRPVRPGGGELTLSVPDSSVPSVRLVGRVVDALGAPASAAVLNPHTGDGSSPILSPRADGSFELGPFPPGEWRLDAQLDGGLEHRRGPRLLAPGETWELGTIRLGGPGSLALRLVGPEGLPADEPPLQLHYGGGYFSAGFERDGELLRAGGLAPGEYALEIDAPGLALALHPFEVREAEETRLAVTLRPGAARAMRVVEAAEPGSEDLLELLIRDARGERLSTSWLRRGPDGAWEEELHLAPGRYQLEARARDGRAARAALVVEDLTPDLEPLVLRLE